MKRLMLHQLGQHAHGALGVQACHQRVVQAGARLLVDRRTLEPKIEDRGSRIAGDRSTIHLFTR
jgi:hypothetical protein